MYTVRVEAGFSAAHFLSEYHGKCENLHGHNYRVLVSARGEVLDGSGMLVDFGILKKVLKHVVSRLDHANLNEEPAFLDSPSAERIARFIYDAMKADAPDLPVCRVDVYETDTSMASYEP